MGQYINKIDQDVEDLGMLSYDGASGRRSWFLKPGVADYVVVGGKKTVGISWGRYTSDKSQQLDLSE